MLQTFSDHFPRIRTLFLQLTVAEQKGQPKSDKSASSTALTVIRKSSSTAIPGTYLGVIARRFQHFQLGAKATLFAQRMNGGRWSASEEICISLSSSLPSHTMVLVTLGQQQQVLSVEDATGMIITLLSTLVQKEQFLDLKEKELLLWEDSLQMQSSIISEKVKALQG